MRLVTKTIGVLALWSLLGTLFLEAVASVAVVEKVEGKPYALRKFKKHYLVKGSELEGRDHLYTGKGGFLRIKLEDATIISLGEKSHLKLSKLTYNGKGKKSERELNLIDGSVRLKVTPLGKEDSFRVKTPVAVAGVRGTNFLCRHHASPRGSRFKGRSFVTVFEGRVAVRTRSGGRRRSFRLVMLKARQQSMVTADAPPSPPKTLSVAKISAIEKKLSVGEGQGEEPRDGGDEKDRDEAEGGAEGSEDSDEVLELKMDDLMKEAVGESIQEIQQNVQSEIVEKLIETVLEQKKIAPPPPRPTDNK